jgi:hypothetical protein
MEYHLKKKFSRWISVFNQTPFTSDTPQMGAGPDFEG